MFDGVLSKFDHEPEQEMAPVGPARAPLQAIATMLICLAAALTVILRPELLANLGDKF